MDRSFSAVLTQAVNVGRSLKRAAYVVKYGNANVIDVTRNVASDVSNLLEDAKSAVRKYGRKHPGLLRTLEPVSVLKDHFEAVVDDLASAFETGVQIQVEAKEGVGWITAPNRAGETIFDDTPSGLTVVSETITLESVDGAYIKLRCGKLHRIELEVRKADGTITSGSNVLALDQWIMATGPHGESIKIVRYRRRDLFGLALYPYSDHGPGKMRSLSSIGLR